MFSHQWQRRISPRKKCIPCCQTLVVCENSFTKFRNKYIKTMIHLQENNYNSSFFYARIKDLKYLGRTLEQCIQIQPYPHKSMCVCQCDKIVRFCSAIHISRKKEIITPNQYAISQSHYTCFDGIFDSNLILIGREHAVNGSHNDNRWFKGPKHLASRNKKNWGNL